VVHLGSVGLATGTGINVDDEIQLKVNDKLKADQKLTYSEAFSQILASDSALAERYHRAHTQRIGAEGPAQ
jgi:fumarate hydratase class II